MTKVSINTPAPDFELTDHTGRSIRLSDFRGKSNVLLVFNRGFVWPFCQKHMAQLRHNHAQFSARDTVILVVGPENTAAFSMYFKENDLPFIGLPDPAHRVLKLFGQEVNLFKLGRMPAQVLVDKSGTARFVHYGHDMTDIPANSEILGLIDQL